MAACEASLIGMISLGKLAAGQCRQDDMGVDLLHISCLQAKLG